MKLFIATPCYGGVVTRNYMLSMLRLSHTLSQKDIPFALGTIDNESLITRARNRLVGQFLDTSDCTHLLFIDADIKFAPDAVFRLLERGEPVVATACPKKSIAWENLYQHSDKLRCVEDLKAASADYAFSVSVEAEAFDHESFDGRLKNGFVKSTYAGTAFMLIQRQVFDTLTEHYPDDRYVNDLEEGRPPRNEFGFFDTLIHPLTKRYLSEDYAFCHKWRRCGGEVWVDVQSPLGHEGAHLFEGDPQRIVTMFNEGQGDANTPR